MALARPLSHGVTMRSRGSGALTVATWLMGIDCPYASTRTVSNSAGVALPERIDASSRRALSSALSMAARQSLAIWGMVSVTAGLMQTPGCVSRNDRIAYPMARGSRPPVGSAHERADALALDRTSHGAWRVDVEHDQRQFVLLTQRDRGLIHDT